MTAFVKYFDSNSKYTNLLVHDKELVKNIMQLRYNAIWDKICNFFKKEFDSEPVHSDKYKNVKMSLYNVNFYGNEILRENKHYNCLSVILDSVVNVQHKYRETFFRKIQICSE